MTPPTRTLAEVAQSELRVAIADVERALGGVAALDAGARPEAFGDLAGSWRRLVSLIDLGPEPEWRDCPACRGPVRRHATRCVHCWKKLAPSE
ncbi:MAG TPA: hypothetical protein VG937_06520 [Polyangiaceae bacterium]|nr:hypothetical protein [Polyangiaceae bacterium]